MMNYLVEKDSQQFNDLAAIHPELNHYTQIDAAELMRAHGRFFEKIESAESAEYRSEDEESAATFKAQIKALNEALTFALKAGFIRGLKYCNSQKSQCEDMDPSETINKGQCEECTEHRNIEEIAEDITALAYFTEITVYSLAEMGPRTDEADITAADYISRNLQNIAQELSDQAESKTPGTAIIDMFRKCASAADEASE